MSQCENIFHFVVFSMNMVMSMCVFRVTSHYKIIRENGGWDNWNMVEIAKYNCNDSTEARIKEQLHYEELNASLNSCPPYVDKIQYYCFYFCY